MQYTTLFKSLIALALAASALSAPTPSPSPVAVAARQTDPEWTYYDTEAECLAAGWGYCRRYAVDVGVSKWVGFPGEQPPTSLRYESEAACLADGNEYCLRIRRADGTIYWLGTPPYEDEEETTTTEPELVTPTSEPAAIATPTDPEWTYYDSEVICLAAGWSYCRSYAVAAGVTKWVGFTGQQPETAPRFTSEAECLEYYSFCLSYKRADGRILWFGVDDESE